MKKNSRIFLKCRLLLVEVEVSIRNFLRKESFNKNKERKSFIYLFISLIEGAYGS